MHISLSLALLPLSLLPLISANPLYDTLLTHEELPSLPPGYSKSTSAPPPDKEIKLRIALAQSDTAGLEKALYDVSTPGSPNYGKHLSKEEVSESVFCLILGKHALTLARVRFSFYSTSGANALDSF